MCMCITCSVWKYVCRQVNLSLQSDIANYWPGMHSTAFLVVYLWTWIVLTMLSCELFKIIKGKKNYISALSSA